jgi:putative transposase
VVRCYETGKIRIERIGRGVLEVEAHHLRPLIPARFNPDRLRWLEDYPKAKQEVAIARHAVVQARLNGGWSIESLTQAAKELGVSVQTVIRWTDWYILSGRRIEVFIPDVFRYGLSHNKLKNPIDEIIHEGIRTIWLVEEKPPLKFLLDWIETTCVERRVDPPSKSAIKKRIRKYPKKEITLRREGVKAARDKYKPLPGRAPSGGRPLGKIEIDTTVLNLFARFPSGKILRLFLTIAIDVFTRMVLGFYLSIHKPDRLAVGLCLYRVMTCKDKWLRKYGIVASWPCWGVPSCVATDSGKPFLSGDFLGWGLRFGFKVQKRKLKRPEGGGHIERLMGQAAMAVEIFQGKTFRNIVEKADYKAEEKAALTVDEIEQALLHYFVEIYHETPHRGLRNRAPIHVWEEWYRQNPKGALQVEEPIEPANDLLMTLLPSFEATIQESGVRRKNIEYFDFALARYVGEENPETGSKKWKFHFHPRYSKFIYWKDPGSDRWRTIPSRDLGMPNLSEDERLDLEEVDQRQAKASIRHDRIIQGRANLFKLYAMAKKRAMEQKTKGKPRKPKKGVTGSRKRNSSEPDVFDPASNLALLAPLFPEAPRPLEKPSEPGIIPIFGTGSL